MASFLIRGGRIRGAAATAVVPARLATTICPSRVISLRAARKSSQANAAYGGSDERGDARKEAKGAAERDYGTVKTDHVDDRRSEGVVEAAKAAADEAKARGEYPGQSPADEAKATAGAAKDGASRMTEEAKQRAEDMAAKAREMAGDAGERAKRTAQHGVESAREAGERVKEGAKGAGEAAADAAREGATRAAEAAQTMGEKAKRMVEEAWGKTKEAAKTTKEAVVGADTSSGSESDSNKDAAKAGKVRERALGKEARKARGDDLP